MDHRIRETQLNLLGQLPAAKITVTLHMSDGHCSRDWWLSATDDDDTQVALWSSRTGPGPWGGLNLADLMVELQDVFRLCRGDPSHLGSV